MPRFPGGRNVGHVARRLFPLIDQQHGEPQRVVAVVVRDENLPGFQEAVAGLYDAPHGAVTGIDEVERSVDDKQVGRLRTVFIRRRTAVRPESDEFDSEWGSRRLARAPIRADD